ETRTMRRLALALALSAGLAALTSAAPHPWHDDGGTVNWKLNYPPAFQLAQQTGKPIFILGVFVNDGNSKNVSVALRETPELHKLVNRYFVPVVLDVEKADPKQNNVLFPRDKLGGNTLPFISFFSDKGVFIKGTNGPRTKEQILDDVKKLLADKAFAV